MSDFNRQLERDFSHFNRLGGVRVFCHFSFWFRNISRKTKFTSFADDTSQVDWKFFTLPQLWIIVILQILLIVEEKMLMEKLKSGWKVYWLTLLSCRLPSSPDLSERKVDQATGGNWVMVWDGKIFQQLVSWNLVSIFSFWLGFVSQWCLSDHQSLMRRNSNPRD